LLSKDVNDIGCVACWVKAMSNRALRKLNKFTGSDDAFLNSLDAYASQYFSFGCTQLLDVEKISDARNIAMEMKEVIGKRHLLAPFGKVLMDLLDGADKKTEEWSRKAETLPLACQGELFRSKFWAALRFQQQSGNVKELRVLTQQNKTADFLTQAETVRDLLTDAKVKENLEFAPNGFRMTEHDVLKFLREQPGRFEKLREWLPKDHPCFCVEKFVVEGGLLERG